MDLEAIQNAVRKELPVAHFLVAANGRHVPVFGFQNQTLHDNDNSTNVQSTLLLCLEPFAALDQQTSNQIAQFANLGLHQSEPVQMELFRTDEAAIEHELIRSAFQISELPNIVSETTPSLRAGSIYSVDGDKMEKHTNTASDRWNANTEDIWQAAVFIRRTIRERLTEFLQKNSDPHLLKLCRRLPVTHRLPVYRFAAGNARRIQLVESHPTLACVIANDLRLIAHVWEEKSSGTPVLITEAKEDLALVDGGALLKELCKRKRVPYWMRRIPMHPRIDINHLTQLPELGYGPEILNVMPKTPHQIGEWISHLLRSAQALTPASPLTHDAQTRVDEAKLWMLNNCMKLSSNDLDRDNKVIEALDYIAAPQNEFVVDRLYQSRDNSNAAHAVLDEDGLVAPLGPDQVINRGFSPGISPARLAEQIEEWHLSLARKQADDIPDFPKPPFEEVSLQDYKLTPIIDAFDLYMEGKAMHHCVATYTGRVLAGESYIYRLTKDDKPVGTVEMATGFPITMKQVSGHCNKVIPQDALAILHAMLGTVHFDIERDRNETSDASNRL